ncbi:hypothetical protein, partial [Staphylococcus aureus]|uniref:hypothetical protein n=1 Tax=Staphylococcus aureus TaxID=1280 RepID=UPI001E38DD24
FEKDLTIKPGYACSEFPDFIKLDDDKICGLFPPITYKVSSRLFGFKADPVIVTSFGTNINPTEVDVPNCENFTYNLE